MSLAPFPLPFYIITGHQSHTQIHHPYRCTDTLAITHTHTHSLSLSLSLSLLIQLSSLCSYVGNAMRKLNFVNRHKPAVLLLWMTNIGLFSFPLLARAQRARAVGLQVGTRTAGTYFGLRIINVFPPVLLPFAMLD